MPESSGSTDAPGARALALARRALASTPAGLLTDFDGTLSPIVPLAADARLAAGSDAALTALADRLAVVAIITGREPLDARRRIGVDGALVVGNHGTEWLWPGADVPVASAAGEAIHRAITVALERVASEVLDASIEPKGLSATVHYRTSAAPERTRRAILDAIGSPPPGVEVREGRMSVELRPVGLGDKGSAARAVVERHDLRGVVVLGDDVTDLDMFAAVAELRATGALEAAILAVGGPDREVPAEVLAAADAVLAAPEDVARLLVGLADESV